jgi:hypothetical protein
MNQYQDDQEAVVYQFEKITTMLTSLDKCYALDGLEERDLPPSLRCIFRALETYVIHSYFSSQRRLMRSTSELDALRRELEQCKKERSILKKIVFRKDMAQRVKQCDGKLSYLLQRFQVRR